MENTSGSSEGHFYYTSSSDVIQTPLSQIPWYSDSIDILFGTMLALGTGVGVVLNFSVFGMFFKHRREFNSRTTWLLMSLALSDGLMALIGGTMFSISSFSHGWPFKDEGCIFYAFTMYATGCTTICHLTIIAIDRALAITTPIKYRSWRKKPALSAVAISIPWVFGLLLAVPPLAGFQRYTYEGRTSCSIDWLSQAPMDIVYTFIMFIAAYFVPLTIMISCYGIIFTTIKASGKKFPGDEASAVKRRKIEIQLAKTFF
ncbi:OPN4 [Bugula neritina]|uniref:OPN4 n=1 Tax=Bugula neritina TaxID=10212 RepID=A0A7J7J8Q6_BUGNE|nr:OPN4 [Bugula neritina]